ncbi:MAG: hypothetical protein ACTXOO_01035 [Sodalis sp. (in: enterobacteria)]
MADKAHALLSPDKQARIACINYLPLKLVDMQLGDQVKCLVLDDYIGDAAPDFSFLSF